MYTTLESHRDQLLEEKNTAVDKVADLKQQLAAMKWLYDGDLKQAKLEIQSREDKIKKCQEALEKVKDDAIEREKEMLAVEASREEGLEGRLRALVEALSGKIVTTCLFFCLHCAEVLNISLCWCSGNRRALAP